MTGRACARLIGRTDELSGALGFAVRDGPWLLIAEGEAGIGKSSFLAALAEQFGSSAWVICTTAVAAESMLSYALLSDLATPLYESAISRLPVQQREALDAALLRGTGTGTSFDARAVGTALLSLIREASAGQDLVLMVDDAQWADAATVEALSFAQRRLDAERCGIVLGRRLGEDAELVDRLAAADSAYTVRLAPLTLEATRTMLVTSLEVPISPIIARRIHDISAGNPLLSLELGRAQLHATGDLTTSMEIVVPSQLAALHRTRLERLSQPARTVVTLAAAHGRPPLALVQPLLGDKEAEAALDEAQAAGILIVNGDITFTHPLLSSAAYEQLSPFERRSVHRRLAEAVTDLEEGARHLALASEGEDEPAATACEEAALAARARGALAAAADLAVLAVRLTPGEQTHDHHRRALIAADVVFQTGNAAAARDLLRRTIATSQSDRERGEALRALARADFYRSRKAQIEILREALAASKADAVGSAEIHIELSMSMALRADECVEHARAAVRLTRDAAEPETIALHARALLALAYTGFEHTCEVDLDLVERAAAVEQEGVEPRSDESAAYARAILLIALDRYAESQAEFESMLERCKRRGEDVLLPEMHGWIARLAWIAGDIDLCRFHARRCTETGNEVGEHFVADIGRLFLLYPLAMVGDADAELEELAGSFPADPHSRGRAYNTAALGHLMVTRGDWEVACQYLEATARIAGSLGNRSWMFRFEGDHIEALLQTSRTDDARRAIERLEYQARLPYARWSRAVTARSRGLLLAADHRFAEARDHFSQAVAESRTLSPLEHGRSLLALGRLERRLKQKRAAREALTSARLAFEAIGATAWVTKTDADLQRIGGRSPTGDDLTATERRIAELAADGMSNKAIAEALFISPRTVESNLTRIYRKLRVRSRIGLSSALNHDPSDMPSASRPAPT